MTAVLLIISAAMSGIVFFFTGLYTDWYWYFIPVLLIIPFYFIAFLIHVILAGILGLFFSKKKPVEKPSKYFYTITVESLKQLLFFLRVRTRLTGIEKLPEGRFLAVYNHVSNFDPLVLVTQIPDRGIILVSKPENEKIPIVGKYMHMSGFLVIDRVSPIKAKKTVDKCADWIKRDIASAAIAPEGTRSKDGRLLPFRAAPFSAAKKSGAPIVIITYRNTQDIKKNFPLRTTKVEMDIADVIYPEQYAELNTMAISALVREKMLSALGQVDCVRPDDSDKDLKSDAHTEGSGTEN